MEILPYNVRLNVSFWLKKDARHSISPNEKKYKELARYTAIPQRFVLGRILGGLVVCISRFMVI